MLLELSEVFVCPRCRPAQGLVVMVDRLDGRRVSTGRLGCPGCDLRVPVERGTIRFERARRAGEPENGGPGPDPAAGGDPDGAAPGPPGGGGDAGRPSRSGTASRPLPELLDREEPGEASVRLAALLAADGAEGYLLLDRALAPLAAGVARRAPDAEVLALVDAPGEEPPEGVAPATGVDPAALPLVTGRMAGAALSAPGVDALREAARVVREGARLAVLDPGPEVRAALERLPLRPVADEERAVVAVRRPGGFEEPFARFPGGPRPRAGPGSGEGDDGGGEA